MVMTLSVTPEAKPTTRALLNVRNDHRQENDQPRKLLGVALRFGLHRTCTPFALTIHRRRNRSRRP
jgi:hypothetical protein